MDAKSTTSSSSKRSQHRSAPREGSKFPKPHIKHISLILSMLSSHVINKFTKPVFVEPRLRDSKTYWCIEFQCTLNMKLSQISEFMNQFKERFMKVHNAYVVSIEYNFKDRLILMVDSTRQLHHKSETQKRSGIGYDPSVKTVSPKDRSSIEFKQSSLKTLEAEKMESVKQCESLVTGINSLPMSEQIATSEPEDASEQPCIDSKAIDKRSKAPPFEIKSVIARMTETSEMYARSRFNDKQVYDMVRLYIAYLGREEAAIVFNGETRVSLGMKILSQGLPLGANLTRLWYEFHQLRGASDLEIRSDLESYHQFCRTSRLIRLQNAREGMRKWYGLKGGFSLTARVPLTGQSTKTGTCSSVTSILDGSPVCRLE